MTETSFVICFDPKCKVTWPVFSKKRYIDFQKILRAFVFGKILRYIGDTLYSCRSQYRNINSCKIPLFSSFLENIEITESRLFRYFSKKSAQCRKNCHYVKLKCVIIKSKSTLIEQRINFRNKWIQANVSELIFIPNSLKMAKIITAHKCVSLPPQNHQK